MTFLSRRRFLTQTGQLAGSALLLSGVPADQNAIRAAHRRQSASRSIVTPWVFAGHNGWPPSRNSSLSI
jgi:hypothetical protein